MKEFFICLIVISVYIGACYITSVMFLNLLDYIALRKYVDVNDIKSVFNSKGKKYSNKEFEQIIKRINKELLYTAKHHRKICLLYNDDLVSKSGNEYKELIIQHYKNFGFEVYKTENGIEIEGWC